VPSDPSAEEEEEEEHSRPQPPSQADAAAAVDEERFYAEVKAALSGKQFKTFTANMKRLNGGVQSCDVTLSNVGGMFTEQPLLLEQLQRVMKQVKG